MSQVFLIGTVHEEVGRASVSALRSILEAIRPEVAFVEVPEDAFEDCYVRFNRWNVESVAIRKYKEAHPLEVVPVDRPLPDPQFFDAEAELLLRIGDESSEYLALRRQQRYLVETHGFRYLNSEYGNALYADIYKEMEASLERLAILDLVEIYANLRREYKLREDEMLRNIYSYSRGQFTRGVFLVGAAHRTSLMEKLQGLTHVEPNPIIWEFPDLKGSR